MLKNIRQKISLFLQPTVLITIGDVTDIFAIIFSSTLTVLFKVLFQLLNMIIFFSSYTWLPILQLMASSPPINVKTSDTFTFLCSLCLVKPAYWSLVLWSFKVSSFSCGSLFIVSWSSRYCNTFLLYLNFNFNTPSFPI